MSSGRDLRAAIAAHREGRLDEADAAYGRVLAVEAEHPEALRLRGALARQRDDLGSAVALLTRAAAAAPHDADPLSELGLSLMAGGDLPAAEDALRRAVACAPRSVKALANLGAVLQFRQHVEQAMACYRAALDVTDDAQITANLASALLDAGHGDEALALCDDALAAGADPSPLKATRGVILNGLTRYGEAVADFQAALQLSPADDMAWVNLAFAQFELGESAAALRSLERAVGINPDNARAVADLMWVLLQQDDAEGAGQLGASFLVRHPGDRQVLAVQSFALQDQGNAAEAPRLMDVEHLIRALQPCAPQAFGDLQAFHDTLAKVVMEDPSLRPGPVTKATRGGRQTGELGMDSHPALTALETIIDAAIGDVLRRWRGSGFADHPVMACAATRWSLRVWGTVLDSGGQQLPHMHPLGWVSGVYYVRLPRDMTHADPHAGCLEFGMPPARYGLSRLPVPTRIEPAEGRLVLFPSYFYHRTRPFVSRQPRISIAFDAVPLRF